MSDEIREHFEKQTSDDFDVDPWLYKTFSKKYLVVLHQPRVQDTDHPEWFSFTCPHYAIPCETGVEITQFAPRCQGPHELAVFLGRDEELAAALNPYLEDPGFLERCTRGVNDPRDRMIWGHVETGMELVFPAEDFDLVAPILRPIPRRPRKGK
jgi:hypothetical protein